MPPETSGPAGDGDTTAPTVAPAIAPKARGIQRITRSLGTFDSLEQREFRWYFLAVVTQMAGMMMQMLVAAYLAFELTGSYAALGGIALASAVPMIGLSLVGGVIADRTSRRRVVQVGQAVTTVEAAVVGLLILFDLLEFEYLLISTVVHGTVSALTMPARQAMIPEIVGRDRLMNAVSLNAAGMNLMRLLAPAVAGVVIEVAGAEWAYFALSALYGLSLLAMFPVPARQPAATVPGRARGAGGLADLREGLRYVLRDRVIMLVLAVNFAISMFAMPYQHLLPGFVSDIFDRGAGALGLLLAINGAGALLGALVMASLPPRRRGLLLLLSSLLIGVALLAFAMADSFWLGAAFMVLVGIGIAGRQATGQVLLHVYVNDLYRGRVVAIFMMQFGVMAFGAFGVGLFAEATGARWAFAFLGVALIVVVLGCLAFVPRIRRLD